MAMNAWGAADPAWWLNLQADPRAVVELSGWIRLEALGRPAVGEERERLWGRRASANWTRISTPTRRAAPHETAIVVLEPRPSPA